MRLSKAWLVALRDFKVFRRVRYVLYSIVIFPVIVSVLFPLLLEFGGRKTGGFTAEALRTLLPSFSFWLVIGAAVIPLGIASYSIVGEKVEKSLEPLLATPLTDGEILLGKTLSALLPALAATYIGAAIFMAGTDAATFHTLKGYFFPNWTIGALLLGLVPAALIMSVEFSVTISSRVNDVRSSSSFAILMFFPFILIYLLSVTNSITLNPTNILIIAGVVFAVDVALFFLSTATFRREEILTKWK